MEKGFTKAKTLAEISRNGDATTENNERFSRDMESEIARIRKTDAVQLYKAGKGEQILDTDLYSYLSVSVRTPRNDFCGRMRAVSDAVEKAAKLDPEPENIICYPSVRYGHRPIGGRRGT